MASMESEGHCLCLDRTNQLPYAEYFEADDNKDLIKKEKEDNCPGTFNSEISSGKRRETLKLRL